MRCLIVLFITFSTHAVEVPRRSILAGGLSGFLRSVFPSPSAPPKLLAPEVGKTAEALTASAKQLNLFQESFATLRRLQLLSADRGDLDWKVNWTEYTSLDALLHWASTHEVPASIARELADLRAMLDEVHVSRDADLADVVRRRQNKLFALLGHRHPEILQSVQADATLVTYFTDQMVALERRVAMRLNIAHPSLVVTVPFITAPRTIIRAGLAGGLRVDGQPNPYSDTLRAEMINEMRTFAPYYAMLLDDDTGGWLVRAVLLDAAKVTDRKDQSLSQTYYIHYSVADGYAFARDPVLRFSFANGSTHDSDPRNFSRNTSIDAQAEAAATSYIDRLATLDRFSTDLGALANSQLKDLVLAEVEILRTELTDELRNLPELMLASRVSDRHDVQAVSTRNPVAWATRLGPLIADAGLTLEKVFPALIGAAEYIAARDEAACAAVLVGSDTNPNVAALPAPADATLDVNFATVAIPEEATISFVKHPEETP